MPQLDLYMWPNDIYWVTLFILLSLSYVRYEYIPFCYGISGCLSFKKEAHQKEISLFDFSHYLNIKQFWTAYKNTRS